MNLFSILFLFCSSCLYGVFEPHNGLDAARFIMQRMAAEILFAPPSSTNTDEEIREKLRFVTDFYNLK